MKILILGGTGEARELADQLVCDGHDVITSLAGRTSEPKLPAGELRVGKFGGVPGLVAYLKAVRIELLIDATHPYAGLISTNAVAAARQTGIPFFRFMRAPWSKPAGAQWQQFAGIAEAAASLPPRARAFVTTGHARLDAFGERKDCDMLVRLIDAPLEPLPRHMRLLIDRPPYSLDGELGLMQREGVTHLVTKNSGGEQTRAKIDAAAALGVAVLMIDRPSYGPAAEVASLAEALALVHDSAS